MANESGTSEAVSQAARLDEIGFPEFTTKLITDVFDALVSSNLRQTEAYMELVNQTGKTLTTFINDTKDDISGDMLLDFLAQALPADADDEENITALPDKNASGNVTLTAPQAAKLNKALDIEGMTDEDGKPINQVSPVSGSDYKYDDILDAVANRVAANKYDLLQAMVKQGILRLVVENGEILTQLSFDAWGSSFSEETSRKYTRKTTAARARAKTGLFTSLWAKASASTKYNKMKVSTARKTDRDTSGSRVNIFGSVKLNFKTDYLPLDQ